MVADFKTAYKRTIIKQWKVCLQVTMVLLFFGPVLHQVDCSSSKVHLKLLEDLEGNYTEPFMRPVHDKTTHVPVGLRFAPLFASLDAAKQELTVRGMLLLKWTDVRLQWQPEDYDDIKETTIPLSFDGNNKFWIPEVSILESLETDFRSFYSETRSATLTYPGEIHWYTLATTKSYCMMDNTNFPFDHQACNLTFTTWLYQTNEQQFQEIDDIVENGTYKMYGLPNALWSVQIKEPVDVGTRSYQCETCTGEKQSFICYQLELKRSHSGLFVWMLGFPCIMVSILLAYIPCMNKKDGIDAPTYGATCVLALFVNLVYLHHALPLTGPALYMGLYITMVIMAGVAAVGFVVFGKFDCNDDKLDTSGPDETAVPSPTPENTPRSGGNTYYRQELDDVTNETTSKENPKSSKSQAPGFKETSFSSSTSKNASALPKEQEPQENRKTPGSGGNTSDGQQDDVTSEKALLVLKENRTCGKLQDMAKRIKHFARHNVYGLVFIVFLVALNIIYFVYCIVEAIKSKLNIS